MDFPPDEFDDDADVYPRGVYVTRYRPRRGRPSLSPGRRVADAVDPEGYEVAYRPIPAGMSRVAAVDLLTARFDAKHPRRARSWCASPHRCPASRRPSCASRTACPRASPCPRCRLHWRGALDKMRKDRWQPVPQPVADARWIAYGWRTSFAYAGSYVLFRPALAVREYDGRADKGRWHTSARRAGRAAAAADQPWSYAAFNRALHAAEARAGVARQDFRAAHGFRRHVLTLLLELTGDSVFAGAYIGDTDLGVLRRSYVRETEDHSREAADLLTGAAAAGPPAAPPAARNRGRTTTAARGGAAVEEEPST